VSGDEAAFLLEALATVDAADDDAPRHHGPGGVGVALAVVRLDRLPDLLARARVDRDHRRVIGREEQLVAVERDVLGRAAEGLGLRRELVGVLPDQLAGRGIDGLQHVAGAGEVHHAVVDQWRPLVAALAHREYPGELQIAHVVAAHLRERTVALGIFRAPPAQPVFRGRIAQHVLADGAEILYFLVHEAVRALRLAGDAAGRLPALPLRRAGRLRDARPDRRPLVAERREPDFGGRVGAQFLRSRRGAIDLEHVGGDGQVFGHLERTRRACRHQVAGIADQVSAGAPAPLRDEVRAGQFRTVPGAVQGQVVTLGTVLRIRALAADGLGLRVDALGGMRVRGDHGGDQRKPCAGCWSGDSASWQCPCLNYVQLYMPVPRA